MVKQKVNFDLCMFCSGVSLSSHSSHLKIHSSHLKIHSSQAAASSHTLAMLQSSPLICYQHTIGWNPVPRVMTIVEIVIHDQHQPVFIGL